MTEWILPCNGKNYNVDAALRELQTIEWFQSKPLSNVAVGDIIYIYESTPVRNICWKCKVSDSHRMVSRINDSQYFIPPKSSNTVFHGPFIEIQAEFEFTVGDRLSYEELKEHGLKSRIQGPLRVNSQLAKYIREVENMQFSPDAQVENAVMMSQKALTQVAIRYSQRPVKKSSITTTQFSRNPYIAEYAKRRAGKNCELCRKLAPFDDRNGRPYLEAHHIKWLSRGGADAIDNVVALCPNCHRKIHVLDDPSDVQKLLILNKLL